MTAAATTDAVLATRPTLPYRSHTVDGQACGGGGVMPKRFNRYGHRCDFCGRFMPWSWVSAWNCFAGYSKAWCQRLACGRAADKAGVA